MLTDRKIRAEKPGAKRTMLYDQRGLYLLVNPNGSKLWRFKCHIGPRGQRREKLLALGAYPEVTLAEARRRQVLPKLRAFIEHVRHQGPAAPRGGASLRIEREKKKTASRRASSPSPP